MCCFKPEKSLTEEQTPRLFFIGNFRKREKKKRRKREKKKMRVVSFLGVLAAASTAFATSHVTPDFFGCMPEDEARLEDCLQRTKSDCNTDKCTWCSSVSFTNAAITAALAGLPWCEVNGDSCACIQPPPSATPTPSLTPAPSPGFDGLCAPASGKLDRACMWYSIATADGRNATCGTIDWGFGGSSGGGSSSGVAAVGGGQAFAAGAAAVVVTIAALM
jgi:hypothetical protein